VARREPAGRRAKLRLQQRAVQKNRYGKKFHYSGRGFGADIVLRVCHHPVNIQKMEDRTGNRRVTVENRSVRSTRVLQQRHRFISEQSKTVLAKIAFRRFIQTAVIV